MSVETIRHGKLVSTTDELDNVPLELRFVGAKLEAQNAKGEAMSFTVTRIDCPQ